MWTAVVDEGEEWSSQWIFQFKQLERRSLKKIRVLIFFRLLLSNCFNWKIHCNDHSSPTTLFLLLLDENVNLQLPFGAIVRICIHSIREIFLTNICLKKGEYHSFGFRFRRCVAFMQGLICGVKTFLWRTIYAYAIILRGYIYAGLPSVANTWLLTTIRLCSSICQSSFVEQRSSWKPLTVTSLVLIWYLQSAACIDMYLLLCWSV